jgi:hypothetical protein
MSSKDLNKAAATNGKAKKKKRSWKKGVAITFGILVLLIVGLYFFPYYGTINYGICRTFVELQEPYPQSIKFINAEEDPYTNSVTISYKKIDPFGLEAMNEIQCFIRTDENGAVSLQKVDINGKKRHYPQEDPEVIRKFNVGLIGLFAYPPSLVMPYRMSNDIKDYR